MDDLAQHDFQTEAHCHKPHDCARIALRREKSRNPLDHVGRQVQKLYTGTAGHNYDQLMLLNEPGLPGGPQCQLKCVVGLWTYLGLDVPWTPPDAQLCMTQSAAAAVVQAPFHYSYVEQ